MAMHHHQFKHDLVEAENMCKNGISLAIQTGNNRRHSQALHLLSLINIRLGRYPMAQMYAYEAQRLARVAVDLYAEAQAVNTQAQCQYELGYYTQSLSLCIMAQSLLGLCGMSDSEVNHTIMTTQAEVHKCKSEYSEAWEIHSKIVRISADRDSYWHALECG
jgi:tetratricopeptide (TPR) repeat protein